MDSTLRRVHMDVLRERAAQRWSIYTYQLLLLAPGIHSPRSSLVVPFTNPKVILSSQHAIHSSRLAHSSTLTVASYSFLQVVNMCDNDADTPFCSPQSGAQLRAGETIESKLTHPPPNQHSRQQPNPTSNLEPPILHHRLYLCPSPR